METWYCRMKIDNIDTFFTSVHTLQISEFRWKGRTDLVEE